MSKAPKKLEDLKNEVLMDLYAALSMSSMAMTKLHTLDQATADKITDDLANVWDEHTPMELVAIWEQMAKRCLILNCGFPPKVKGFVNGTEESRES